MTLSRLSRLRYALTLTCLNLETSCHDQHNAPNFANMLDHNPASNRDQTHHNNPAGHSVSLSTRRTIRSPNLPTDCPRDHFFPSPFSPAKSATPPSGNPPTGLLDIHAAISFDSCGVALCDILITKKSALIRRSDDKRENP